MTLPKRTLTHSLILVCISLVISCSNSQPAEKGFQVSPYSETANDENGEQDGISKDSLTFTTRPSNVLLTGVSRYRLATIYKVNYTYSNYRRDSTAYIGENNFHYNYDDFAATKENAWHYNLMPGLEAVYGYNFVNVSLHDSETQTARMLFDKPVLVKTLYYPSFSTDTLYSKPIFRNYYLISAYDEDTNKDGYINLRDLRHLYYFQIDGGGKEALVPPAYSVVKSEYDARNDVMYVFAQLDENKNGAVEDLEAMHIFWIDLKDPRRTGRQY